MHNEFQFVSLIANPSFKKLANLLSDAICLIEKDSGKLLYANQATHQLLEFSSKPISSISIINLFSEFSDLDTFQRFTKDITANNPLSIKGNFRSGKGIPFPVNMDLLYNKENEDIFLAVIKNLSAQTEKESQLQTIKEKLNIKNKALLKSNQEYERLNNLINIIDEGSIKKTGESYFKTVVKLLNRGLDADNTYIAHLSKNHKSAQTLYWMSKSGEMDNIQYDLAHTPCQNVANRQICIYPSNIKQLFPKDLYLQEENIEGYLGVPIRDENQKKTNFILVSTFRDKIKNPEEKVRVLNIFSQRIKNELVKTHLSDHVREQSNENSKLLKIEKDLQKNISEKKILLKEIHHRVKNNMQVITSLLSLQSSFLPDNETKEIFRNSQHRINSMAMVHEMLYLTNEISKINYQDYLNRLIQGLISGMNSSNTEINTIISAPNIYLNIDTSIPLGLLINEIITNSLKYGFKNLKKGTINAQVTSETYPNFKLEIGDDGVGFPATYNLKESNSLGLRLIEKLTIQLKGKIERDHNKKGTNYILYFQEIIQTS